MRLLFTVGFIFLNVLGLNAQSDFRDGYIITNENDTIYGLLDYKGNRASAKKCVYKEGIESKSQTFTPDEIKGYRFINSKYYVSRFVSQNDENVQLFLEYLINGIVDIYYYRDDLGEHYFVDNNTGDLYELKNSERELLINNGRYINRSKEYIGVLKAIFAKSPSISKRVENIGLSHKALINITNAYHTEVCSGEECIIYEKNFPKVKSTFGIVIGLGGTSVSQTSDFSEEFYYMRNSQFGFSISPSMGFFYKKNMPFVDERLYFQYEGTYSRISLTTYNSYFEPVYGINYVNDITFTRNTFNSLIILKHEFPKGKIRPTFQIGGFLKYSFTTKYSRNLEVRFPWEDPNQPIQTNQINNNPFSKFDFGINLGTGLRGVYLKNKELFLDFRYQRGLGLLPSLNTNTFLVNLGFQLGG